MHKVTGTHLCQVLCELHHHHLINTCLLEEHLLLIRQGEHLGLKIGLKHLQRMIREGDNHSLKSSFTGLIHHLLHHELVSTMYTVEGANRRHTRLGSCILTTHQLNILFTETTVLTLVEFATETFLHLHIEFLSQRFELDLVDDLSHESILEQGACLCFRDATLTHIEEGCFIHHTHCGAMGTLDIVCIDFKHGLGVHSCIGRGTEIEVFCASFSTRILPAKAPTDLSSTTYL